MEYEITVTFIPVTPSVTFSKRVFRIPYQNDSGTRKVSSPPVRSHSYTQKGTGTVTATGMNRRPPRTILIDVTAESFDCMRNCSVFRLRNAPRREIFPGFVIDDQPEGRARTLGARVLETATHARTESYSKCHGKK